MSDSDKPKDDVPAPDAAPDFLDATDTFGRRVRLPRDEYRDRVLPELVKAHGNDPAQLASVIMQALQQGFAKDLVQAANLLVAIDQEPERALSVRWVVQRDAGDLEAADCSLEELLGKRPDSISARVGKAMLAERRLVVGRSHCTGRVAAMPHHASSRMDQSRYRGQDPARRNTTVLMS